MCEAKLAGALSWPRLPRRLGGRWSLAAHTANERAANLDAQISEIDAEIARLQPKQAIPDAYPSLLEFVSRAAGLQQALDPNAALQELRSAAGDDVRILRLRLEADTGGKGHRLRVDGMVNHGPNGNSEGMQVARFVQRLRAAGYLPEAIDPQQGNVRSQSVGGAFSYLLRRAATTTPEKAS